MMSAREYFVYRLFDADGELLYVGCTNNFIRRWSEHHGGHRRMVRAARRCHAQGPYTRDVARRLERVAAQNEHPLYGWTPQKQSRITKRIAWEKQLTAELMRDGWKWETARQCASDEAHREFGPEVSYYTAWRPEVIPA